jgi:hypothetical protein
MVSIAKYVRLGDVQLTIFLLTLRMLLCIVSCYSSHRGQKNRPVEIWKRKLTYRAP